MNKKKTLQLVAFILCVLVLIKVWLVALDNRDRSNAPTWEEVERAYNFGREMRGDLTNPQPSNQKSQ